MPQKLEWTLDVNAPLSTIQTPTLMMQGDNQANTFVVHLTDKGQPYDLSGHAAVAWLERSDGVRIMVDGSVNRNTVEVTLTEACYRVSGRYIAFVRITNADTDEKRTILRVTGMMESEGNGPIMDDENVIPSIDDIVAQLQIMEQATAAAKTATSDANAAAANANESADQAMAAAQTVMDQLESGALVGQGLQILGYYDTASDLASGALSPSAGDAYGVGTGEPYDIYVWDALNGVWVNNGAIQGPKGDQGPKGENGRNAMLNLLDNSDFRNPVNQRGQTSYAGSVYTIDRWMLWNENNDATLTINNGYITHYSGTSNGTLSQILPFGVLDSTKKYTLAVKKSDGTIEIKDKQQNIIFNFNSLGDLVTISVGTDNTESLVWAALYEGEYTAETLPEYIPKGYAAELAECLRYFYRMAVSGTSGEVNNIIGYGYWASTNTLRVTVILPQIMRIKPSVIMSGEGLTSCVNGSTAWATITALTSLWTMVGNNFTLLATSTGGTTGEVGWLRLNVNGVLDFSADL